MARITQVDGLGEARCPALRGEYAVMEAASANRSLGMDLPGTVVGASRVV
ncbi:MAG: hypothetical protein ACRDVC_02135 [Acidimicrobiales bacterium]